MVSKRFAFTMIELVFVIVIIGILSAIAIPRLAATRTDAVIVKAKSQIAAIKSGIVMQKAKNLLEGNRQTSSYYPDNLDDVNATGYNTTGKKLFYFNDGNDTNILESPILSRANTNGSWVKTNANVYNFAIESGSTVTFTYNPANGTFNCTPAGATCNTLTQ